MAEGDWSCVRRLVTTRFHSVGVMAWARQPNMAVILRYHSQQVTGHFYYTLCTATDALSGYYIGPLDGTLLLRD